MIFTENQAALKAPRTQNGLLVNSSSGGELTPLPLQTPMASTSNLIGSRPTEELKETTCRTDWQKKRPDGDECAAEGDDLKRNFRWPIVRVRI